MNFSSGIARFLLVFIWLVPSIFSAVTIQPTDDLRTALVNAVDSDETEIFLEPGVHSIDFGVPFNAPFKTSLSVSVTALGDPGETIISIVNSGTINSATNPLSRLGSLILEGISFRTETPSSVVPRIVFISSGQYSLRNCRFYNATQLALFAGGDGVGFDLENLYFELSGISSFSAGPGSVIEVGGPGSITVPPTVNIRDVAINDDLTISLDNSNAFIRGISANYALNNVTINANGLFRTPILVSGDLSIANTDIKINMGPSTQIIVPSSAPLTVSSVNNLNFCGYTMHTRTNFTLGSLIDSSVTIDPSISNLIVPPFAPSDRCGVCGGFGEYEDCEGTCYGLASNCLIPDIYVAVNGSSSASGSISDPFDNILNALNAAVYGATIYLFPGTYRYTPTNCQTIANPLAFTMKSTTGNPEDVIIDTSACATGIRFSNSFKRYIFEGITFYSNNSGSIMQLSVAQRGIQGKYRNCIFQVDPANSPKFALDVKDFAFIELERCVFMNLQTDTAPISVVGRSFLKVRQSRFKNNTSILDGIAPLESGVFSVKDSGIEVYDSVFEGNTFVGSNAGSVLFLSGVDFQTVVVRMERNSFFTQDNSNNLVTCDSSMQRNTWNFQSNFLCGIDSFQSNCPDPIQPTLSSVPTEETCGACSGASSLISTVKDCNDECFGYAVEDSNQGCCLISERNCADLCGTEFELDRDQECCEASRIDCLGDCDGTTVEDRNGVCCFGPLDCEDDCNGTKVRDGAGSCCPPEFLVCNICNGTCDPGTTTPPPTSPNPSGTSSDSQQGGDNGLSSTTILAIGVVGGLAVLFAFAFLVGVIFWKRRKQRREKNGAAVQLDYPSQ